MKSVLKLFVILILIITTGFASYEAHAQDPQLERVQTFLTEQGYELGVADGFMGPRTQAALASFQLENNLIVTGKVDPDTLVKIEQIV